METVKFEVKKERVIFYKLSFIINLTFHLGLFLWLLFHTIKSTTNKTLDAEYFSWFLFLLIPLILLIFCIEKFSNYSVLKKLKTSWGVNNSNIIEIPNNELEGIVNYWNHVLIKTKKNRFLVVKDYFEDLDYVSKLPQLPNNKRPNYFKTNAFQLILLVSFGFILWFLSVNTICEGKYNLKYLIPALQIETIQLEVKYIQDTDIIYTRNDKKERNHLFLIDSVQFRITAPDELFLADKILNITALKKLRTGAPIKIKIRPKDYKKFIKDGSSDWYFPFYELEANGDILYQKRGLKEDFETATF